MYVCNVLIFYLFLMERSGVTRGHCHFVGKTMINLGQLGLSRELGLSECTRKYKHFSQNDVRRLIIIFMHNSAFYVSVDFTSSMNGKFSSSTSTKSHFFRNFCFYSTQVAIRSYRLNNRKQETNENACGDKRILSTVVTWEDCP